MKLVELKIDQKYFHKQIRKSWELQKMIITV